MKSHLGPAVAQSNRNIRKMLRLARASRNDIFYDLGCGRAQLCIIAVTEFHVKRAVGIERLKGRAKKAGQHVKNLGLSHRIEIRNEEFYNSDIAEATIAYNGLMEDHEDLGFYENNLRKGCRLVTLSLPLVSVLSITQDYPFYLMRTPFRKTRNVTNWIHAVLSKKASLKEFLTEVDKDPDYWTDRRTLRSLMKKRFSSSS